MHISTVLSSKIDQADSDIESSDSGDASNLCNIGWANFHASVLVLQLMTPEQLELDLVSSAMKHREADYLRRR
jgi:hypothetical protein